MKSPQPNLEKYFNKARSQKPLLDAEEARNLLESATAAGNSYKSFKSKNNKGLNIMNLITTSLAVAAAVAVFTIGVFHRDSEKGFEVMSRSTPEKQVRSADLGAGSAKGASNNSYRQESSQSKNDDDNTNNESIASQKENETTNQNADQPKQECKRKEIRIIKKICINRKENTQDNPSSVITAGAAQPATDKTVGQPKDLVVLRQFNPSVDVRGVNLLELNKDELDKLGIKVGEDGSLTYWDSFDKKPVRCIVYKTGGVSFIEGDDSSMPASIPPLSPRMITDNSGARRICVFKDDKFDSQVASMQMSEVYDSGGSSKITDSFITVGKTDADDSTQPARKKHITYISKNCGDSENNPDETLLSGYKILINDDSLIVDVDSIVRTALANIDYSALIKNSETTENQLAAERKSLGTTNAALKTANVTLETANAALETTNAVIETIDRQFEAMNMDFDTLNSQFEVINKEYLLDTTHSNLCKNYKFACKIDTNCTSALFDKNEGIGKLLNNCHIPNAVFFCKDAAPSGGRHTQIHFDGTGSIMKLDMQNSGDNFGDNAKTLEVRIIGNGIDPLYKINKLVPIVVSVDGSAKDGNKNFAYILWFEPTDDFIKMLPERLQGKIEPEIKALNESKNECVQMPIKGEQPVFDVWRACSGAIEKLMLNPNPAHSQVEVRFTLTEDRNASISLHDLFGRRLRVLSESRNFKAGEQSEIFTLQSMEPGMYLIVVRTDKNEQAVQRLIIE